VSEQILVAARPGPQRAGLPVWPSKEKHSRLSLPNEKPLVTLTPRPLDISKTGGRRLCPGHPMASVVLSCLWERLILSVPDSRAWLRFCSALPVSGR